ncbi:MAG: iron-sulfur cluster carrier protein ApbC [Gammaproteobacteria bacterium]|nr:iron-sulfur cluster carrier protein ApbC [Gammaproteobacteria bacterium]
MSNPKIVPHAVQPSLKPLPNVKNIIAVGSGKGGVGKSTVAVNLALALAKDARVGILDADIYGPSLPIMLGLTEKPESPDGKTISPIEKYGLQCMSIGLLLVDNAPAIWRGPIVTKALQQMLFDTNWDNLDYLIIDLPPGTGDIQLTLAQKIPVAGAIIVTTPQDLALIDAKKALNMFNKVHVPVLGIVENMSTYICTQCGHEEHIFGHAGAVTMAADYKVPLLAQLPLEKNIREETDSGRPTVIAAPESPRGQCYFQLAQQVVEKLALRPKDYSAKFGTIVVQN